MTALKPTSASALHLVQQTQADHEDHQHMELWSQVEGEKAIKQESQIEQEQVMTQGSQAVLQQQLDLDQAVNFASVRKDQEIESPAHYVEGRTIQPIEAIENWDLNHHLACALKYIARAGRKHDEVKDLRKAVWYLSRRIKLLEQQE
ncbi:MAG: DUF3310 domain-containing protein [Janthinobacterium lividum]